ncbi:MAG TPA: NADH-quinone oxidoreductase subunit F [Clostridiales bacterium]|nr:NADH-quinone oxidoreductase subunit F [Clostridiales bacterium]
MRTVEELDIIKGQYEASLHPDVSQKQYRIHVCKGTGCNSSKSPEILKRFEEEIEKHGIGDRVTVVKTGCFGLCALGPIVIIHPDNAFYSQVKMEEIPRIVEEHLVNGNPVKEFLYQETIAEAGHIKPLEEVPFYSKQKRVILKNCGEINPESIAEYITVDGYKALAKVLTGMSREEVIQLIKDAGLRGRGGAGFPTGIKWEFTYKAEGDVKYVACNADEGDPGAFMNRSVLEGDPHAVIEGMAIAAYVIGASKGFIYVRAEYPIAVKRLKLAIEQAKQYGVLGNDIFGTGFNFELEIRLGAGAFVCGEETALMTSIAGNRGEPRVKPPFPAYKGIFGKPTVLNNVETYANVPQIILKGVDWFRSMGTEKAPGTKVFAIGGKVVHVGLVEVPMGTTLREIIFDICGGIADGKKFKAAQTGGPSGGCITEENLDTPIDYESLIAMGTMMGSGGIIVMDEDDCMVDIAKFFLEFTVDESCGKCTPCRIGNKRLYEILEKITQGKGKEEDLERLEVLGKSIIAGSLCGLGKSSPNPILSTLRYFKDEYIAHVRDKKCPAHVCKSLKEYRILEDKCIGCTLCARNCPAACITGETKKAHLIDKDKCTKCGVCHSKCKFGAIEIR